MSKIYYWQKLQIDLLTFPNKLFEEFCFPWFFKSDLLGTIFFQIWKKEKKNDNGRNHVRYVLTIIDQFTKNRLNSFFEDKGVSLQVSPMLDWTISSLLPANKFSFFLC